VLSSSARRKPGWQGSLAAERGFESGSIYLAGVLPNPPECNAAHELCPGGGFAMVLMRLGQLHEANPAYVTDSSSYQLSVPACRRAASPVVPTQPRPTQPRRSTPGAFQLLQQEAAVGEVFIKAAALQYGSTSDGSQDVYQPRPPSGSFHGRERSCQRQICCERGTTVWCTG